MPPAQGYVPQDDVLPGTSTVWEYLSFHAELRLPDSASQGARAARVQAIIDQLSLAKVQTLWFVVKPRCKLYGL